MAARKKEGDAGKCVHKVWKAEKDDYVKCGKPGTYQYNPVDRELRGVKNLQPLCSDCYRQLQADV